MRLQTQRDLPPEPQFPRHQFESWPRALRLTLSASWPLRLFPQVLTAGNCRLSWLPGPQQGGGL